MILSKNGLAIQDFLHNRPERYLELIGGSRSGKNWGVAQNIINTCIKYPNTKGTVASESYPHLKNGAFSDMSEIIDQEFGRTSAIKINSGSELKIFFSNGSEVDFLSGLEPKKLKGPKRDFVYLNECDRLQHEAFRHLNIRAGHKVIMDYNPHLPEFWIDIERQALPDQFITVKSTFMDNIEFLPPSQIQAILDLKKTDIDFWLVYGLGLKGKTRDTIYNHFQVKQFNMDDIEGEAAYAIDFGYNHPNAIVQGKYLENVNTLYIKELSYKRELDPTQLTEEIKRLEIPKNALMWGDSARPDLINGILNAGYNIDGAKKGANSVIEGINKIKTTRVVVEMSSLNLIKEYKNYKWKKDKTGNRLDEPVKKDDDLMDALRYLGIGLMESGRSRIFTF